MICTETRTLNLADLQVFQGPPADLSFAKVFDVECGKWNAVRVDDDVKVPSNALTILIRFGGVTLCPEFGAEVEETYRTLDLPIYKPVTPQSRLDTWVKRKCLCEIRTVYWGKVCSHIVRTAYSYSGKLGAGPSAPKDVLYHHYAFVPGPVDFRNDTQGASQW